MSSFKIYDNKGAFIVIERKEEIIQKIEGLNFKDIKECTFSRSLGATIKIEVNAFNRYHIYRNPINTTYQTVHPLPKKIVLERVNRYLDGDKSWYKGIRFVKAEVEGYIPPEEEIPLKNKSDIELVELKNKNIAFGLGALLVSISLFIYIYHKWDNMFNMNGKVFYWIMGLMIGGLVFSIYSLFDFIDHKKEIKRRTNR